MNGRVGVNLRDAVSVAMGKTHAHIGLHFYVPLTQIEASVYGSVHEHNHTCLHVIGYAVHRRMLYAIVGLAIPSALIALLVHPYVQCVMGDRARHNK